jgi:hypothetical protein
MHQKYHTYQRSLFDELDNDIKINRFFAAVPSLDFSDTGLRNICNRFKIFLEQLHLKIQAFEAQERFKR